MADVSSWRREGCPLRVICRVRPFVVSADAASPQSTVAFQSDTMLVAIPPDRPKHRQYGFDKVLCSVPEAQLEAGLPVATQQDVHNEVGVPAVEAALQGYNTSILTFGHPDSGKTYTMRGTPDDPGLVQGVCGDLFRRLGSMMSESTGLQVKVDLSVLEITETRNQEKIWDLLNCATPRTRAQSLSRARAQSIASGGGSVPKTVAPSLGRQRAVSVKRVDGGELEVRLDPDLGPHVPGLHRPEVKCWEDVRKYLHASERWHDTTIRSHIVIQLTVTVVDHLGTIAGKDFDHVTTGRIVLVDLASADTSDDSSAVNKSITALGRVIDSLAEKRGHIPYRDSVLTHLLSPSLGGTARSTLIACISPSPQWFDETNFTLRYASRARRIRNRIKANPSQWKELQRQAKELAKRLSTQNKVGDATKAEAIARLAAAKEEHMKQTQEEMESDWFNQTQAVDEKNDSSPVEVENLQLPTRVDPGDLLQRVHKLESQVDDMATEKEQLESERAALEADKARMQATIKDLQVAEAKAEGKIRELEAQREGFGDFGDEDEDMEEELRKTIGELKHANTVLAGQLAHEEQRRKEIQLEHRETHEELTEMQQLLDKAEDGFGEMKAKVADMEREAVERHRRLQEDAKRELEERSLSAEEKSNQEWMAKREEWQRLWAQITADKEDADARAAKEKGELEAKLATERTEVDNLRKTVRTMTLAAEEVEMERKAASRERDMLQSEVTNKEAVLQLMREAREQAEAAGDDTFDMLQQKEEALQQELQQKEVLKQREGAARQALTRARSESVSARLAYEKKLEECEAELEREQERRRKAEDAQEELVACQRSLDVQRRAHEEERNKLVASLEQHQAKAGGQEGEVVELRESLKACYATRDSQREVMQEEIDRRDATIARMEQQIDDVQEDSQRWRGLATERADEANAATREAEETAKQFSAKQAEWKELWGRLEDGRKELQAQVRQLQKEKEDMSRELASALATIADQKDQLQALNAVREQALTIQEQTYDMLQDRESALDDERREAERVRQQATETEQQLRRSRSESVSVKQSAERQASELQKLLTTLKENLAEKEAEIAKQKESLEDAEGKVSAMEAAAQEKAKEVAALEEKVKAQEDAMTKVEAKLLAEREAREAHTAAMEADLGRTEARIVDLERQIPLTQPSVVTEDAAVQSDEPDMLLLELQQTTTTTTTSPVDSGRRLSPVFRSISPHHPHVSPRLSLGSLPSRPPAGPASGTSLSRASFQTLPSPAHSSPRRPTSPSRPVPPPALSSAGMSKSIHRSSSPDAFDTLSPRVRGHPSMSPTHDMSQRYMAVSPTTRERWSGGSPGALPPNVYTVTLRRSPSPPPSVLLSYPPGYLYR